MRSRLALAILIASLSIAVQAQEAPAPAAAPPPPLAGPAPGASESYVGLRLGAVIPQHSDLDGFDNGFAFDVYMGRRFHPNFAIEGSIGRFAMSATATQYDPSIGTYTVTAEMVAIPVAVSLKAIYPGQSIEFYGDVGAGLYFMTFSGDADVPGFGPVHVSDSDNPFAFHLGAGIQGRVSEKVKLGLDLKYVIGTASFNGSKGSFDSLLLTGAISYSF